VVFAAWIGTCVCDMCMCLSLSYIHPGNKIILKPHVKSRSAAYMGKQATEESNKCGVVVSIGICTDVCRNLDATLID
jgi:hypothetical protein